MTKEELLPRMRMLLPNETVCDMLLLALLQSAIGQTKAFTWRESLPDDLAAAVVKIALIDYNRLGAEGEKSHAEGAVSAAFDALPEDVRQWLEKRRCAACG